MQNIRKQAEWKSHVGSIHEELETHTFPVLEKFRFRFSELLLEIELSITEDSASESLKPLQKAVTHALQLYRVQDTLKLLANYDLSQGFNEVILAGIQKSWKSLSVIHLLKPFAQCEEEQYSLHEYQNTLEANLCEVLGCERKLLSQKRKVAQRIASLTPENPSLNFFFEERLKGLFSPHYHGYLILRNRYFSKKVEQMLTQASEETWLIKELQRMLSFPDPMPLMQQLDLLDFQEMEQLIKKMSSKFPALSQSQIAAPPPPPSPPVPSSDELFVLVCRYYEKPLHLLKNHLQWQQDCSSPYFLSKSEDYISTVAQEFEIFFEEAENYASLSSFLHLLLKQNASEYPHTIRQEEVLDLGKEGADWKSEATQIRKKEWSFMLKFPLPFSVLFLTEDQKTIRIKAKTPFIIQWGVGFFDEDLAREQRSGSQAQAFFKLLMQGHILSRNSSVIHVGDSAFYVLTPQQSFSCKKLILLCFISLHQSFDLPISDVLKQYLVKQLLST